MFIDATFAPSSDVDSYSTHTQSYESGRPSVQETFFKRGCFFWLFPIFAWMIRPIFKQSQNTSGPLVQRVTESLELVSPSPHRPWKL